MRLVQLWQRLSPREQLLAGLAGLALFLVVVRYGVVGPYLDYTSALEEEIEQDWQRVSKMERQSTRVQQVGEQLHLLRQQFSATWQNLIPGATPSVAAANLQERVRTLASQNGLDLVTTQVMRDEAIGEFRKATVQVTLRGDLPAIANFLAGVEYGDWRLAVATLEVRSAYTPRLAQTGTRGPLTITLEVSGVMQGAEAPVVAANTESAAPEAEEAPAEVEESSPEAADAGGNGAQEE
ncbi:MAG: type II secretion system protein M [Deltaproteobacteria bacterium]|nr:type II secretion system protein M [Deltaproteobacteria bacterium]